jgi:uncharacterized protein (DUF4415 family)
MRKEGNIVSYTADEIEERIARGEDQTDWARVDALSDEEIEASIDYDDEGRFTWENSIPAAMMIVGANEAAIRLDDDIFDWFRSHGGDTQAKINAVLRAYMDGHQEEAAKPRRRKVS